MQPPAATGKERQANQLFKARQLAADGGLRGAQERRRLREIARGHDRVKDFDMAERDARHCGFLVGGSGVLPESRWRVRCAYPPYTITVTPTLAGALCLPALPVPGNEKPYHFCIGSRENDIFSSLTAMA